MSRIPRPLARRLDALARRAHRFHRFAHHPLCAAYEREVVRLGRRGRLCRGCATAAAGGAAGIVAGALAPGALPAWPPAPSPLAVAALAAVACGAALLSTARPHGVPGGARSSKLLTRGAPCFVAGATGAAALLGWGAAGAPSAAAILLALALAVGAYRRRGPDRRPCVACEERQGQRVCSGYEPLVRRERAFARRARRIVAAGVTARASVMDAPGAVTPWGSS